MAVGDSCSCPALELVHHRQAYTPLLTCRMLTSARAARANLLKEALSYSSLNHDADLIVPALTSGCRL